MTSTQKRTAAWFLIAVLVVAGACGAGQLMKSFSLTPQLLGFIGILMALPARRVPSALYQG